MTKSTYSKDGIELHPAADFEGMRRAGRLAAAALDYITPFVVPGAITGDLDKKLEDFTTANGAVSATIGYKGYKHASCISINQVVCHGIPSFEKKLAEHEAPGLEITSARALFDLWIDAAEEAFADMALSGDYRETYGAKVNAQMRLRQDVQKEIEHATGQLGMPTRTEIEAAHRKIAELERIVRRMMRGEAASAPRAAAESSPKRATSAKTKKTAAKPASKPARKAPAKKAATKSATKKAASKKPAAKKPTAKKSARKSVKRSR